MSTALWAPLLLTPFVVVCAVCARVGHAGANQCVMAAKLGAKTAMVAKVGDDIFGKDTVQNFRTLGVDTAHVSVTSDAATGCAPITVSGEW